MKKIFYMLPLALLMIVAAAAAESVTWTCPVSGTSTSSSVADNVEYEDDGSFDKCKSKGNNFTIEFTMTFDAVGEGAGTYANATLYLLQGNKVKHTLPLSSNFTNGTMIRWTDFGELDEGKPKWVGNMTEGVGKWYIMMYNVTDASDGSQFLSTTTGMDDNYPVTFIIDGDSNALKSALAAEAASQDDASAPGVGKGKYLLWALLILVVLYAAKKKD